MPCRRRLRCKGRAPCRGRRGSAWSRRRRCRRRRRRRRSSPGPGPAPPRSMWCGQISRRSREIDGDHAGRRQGDGDAHAHDRYRRSWQDKACSCACAWAILRYLEITRVDATVGEGRSRRDLGRSRVDQTRSLRGRTCGQGWDRGRGSVQILEVRFWYREDRGKIPAACVWQCACEAGLRCTQRPKGGRRAFSAASRSAFAFAACAGAE